MADYTKFFKKQEENIPILDRADQDKLQAYTNRLDTYDPKAELKKQMEQQMLDSNKAMEIAGRGPLQEKSEEEKQFEEKHLDPYSRGMLQGGFMGSVGAIGKAAPVVAREAAAVVGGPFSKIQKMFQVGEHVFPAANEAQALQVTKALEKTGKLQANPLGHTIKKL